MDQKTLTGYLIRHIAYILGDRESAIDLSGSDIRGLSLIPEGLTTAHLRGATINDCLMQSSNLCCADLKSTRLRSSVLDGSDMSGADLALADLTDASLRGCNLKEAYLFDTKLIGADLSNADLRGATILHTNLAYCTLNGARFDDFDVAPDGPTPEQWAVIRKF